MESESRKWDNEESRELGYNMKKYKRIIIVFLMMFALLITYLIEKILPFHILVFSFSFSWVILFLEVILSFILIYFLVKSNLKLRWKIGLLTVVYIVLVLWISFVYLTDEFQGIFCDSTIISESEDGRKIVIVHVGDFRGCAFKVYKTEHGITTYLGEDYSILPLSNRSYRCRWEKDKIYIFVSGEDIEYFDFVVTYE